MSAPIRTTRPSKSDLDAVLKALEFAAEHHLEDGSVQVRKGTTVPYLSHLMIVAGFVWESGGDTNQAVAGVLHDTLEDTAVTRELLTEVFGVDVATLVVECSDGADGQPRDNNSWRCRKQKYIDNIATKSDRAKLVTAADKAHNGSAIVADVRSLGDNVWTRFNATPNDILWYYDEVLTGVIDALAGTPVLARLKSAVDDLRDLVRTRAEAMPIEMEACPRCGGSGVPLVYGFPTPETLQAAQGANFAFGGCMPSPFDARCSNCGHEWTQASTQASYGPRADG